MVEVVGLPGDELRLVVKKLALLHVQPVIPRRSWEAHPGIKTRNLEEDMQSSVRKLKEESGGNTLGLATQRKLLYISWRQKILVGEWYTVRLEHLSVVAAEGIIGGIREVIAVVTCHGLCRPDCTAGSTG